MREYFHEMLLKIVLLQLASSESFKTLECVRKHYYCRLNVYDSDKSKLVCHTLSIGICD